MKPSATKKALLLNITSLILCLAMFVSSTFAWFTDTATSGVNKIIAGNLDLKVSYLTKDAGGSFKDHSLPESWADLEGSASLFSNDKWEPGHTEIVYLKVENNGSLAFNYMMNVTPINEVSGINVAGDSFKLSDYLVFKTSEPDEAFISYTRETARTAAGVTRKLDQAALTKTGAMLAGAPARYIALIIYMPEDVGNEANYKTGTTPPEIELSVTFVATQKSQENDGFGNDYDSGADLSPDNVNSDYLSYVVITPVNITEPVTVGGDKKTTAPTTLTKTENSETRAEAVIPVGVLMADGVTEATLIVAKDSANMSLHVAAGNDEIAIPLEVKVEGVSPVNTTPIRVTYFIGKNLTGVKIYHKGVLIASAYDPATGLITFETATFSPFTVICDKPSTEVYPTGVTADSFPAGKNLVGNDGNYYVDLKSAIAAGVTTVYAKEKSTLKVAATDTNRTDAIINDLTVYANGANFQGGEIQIWANANSPAVVTIKIYNSKNLSAWGAPTTNGVTYNVTFTNSTNNGQFVMYRWDDSSTDAINATLINCNMTGIGAANENAVHTTSIGSVSIIGCTFNNVGVPINIALKQLNGTMTVNVKDSEFIKCGRVEPSNDYHAPVRMVNSGADNTIIATVTNNVFVNTVGTNGDILVGDYRDGKTSNPLTVSVTAKGDTEVFANYMLTTVKDGITKSFSYAKPDENTVILTPATFNASALASNKTIILTAGEYKMPSSGITANITIKGTRHSIIDVSKGAYLDSATLTFEGVSFKCSTGYVYGADGKQGSDYAALYSPNVTYKNCSFDGGFRVGRSGAKFIGCTFDLTATSNTGVGYVWTYGQDVTFEGCTFNTDGKALLIYSDGGSRISKVSVTGSTFNATTGAKAGAIANQNCAAIEIDNYGCGVELTVSGNTIDSDFSGQWRIKSFTEVQNTVTVNNTEYNTIALDGKLMTKDGSNNVTVVD